jgi:hypothetical protein
VAGSASAPNVLIINIIDEKTSGGLPAAELPCPELTFV